MFSAETSFGQSAHWNGLIAVRFGKQLASEADAKVQERRKAIAWCAFAPGKEAWKRNGNFYTAEELRKMDQVDDFSMSEPVELSAL